MTARNTETSFGWVARSLHWATALLILLAIPLGLYANQMPYDTDAALAAKAQVFSIHKTLGVAAFLVAVLRILWALVQPRPRALHPGRRLETTLADTVHWLLYASLVVVPLSGWVHHAAVSGFAPILWPFGQTLPFVPKSEALGALAGAVHWVFTKVLAATILLHVAGALKHHLIDRDATLLRMTRGLSAGPEMAEGSLAQVARLVPVVVVLAVYGAGAGLAVALVGGEDTSATVPAEEAAAAQPGAGNWQVETGSLSFSVTQMGQAVGGQFARWTADITFDPTAAAEGRHGEVTVRIDTASLTLGSVTDQAKGKDFFDTASFPEAVFTANILAEGDAFVARGTLLLRGVEAPVSLPFRLEIDGDRARMTGATRLDRRSFGMGAAYGDETTVGFGVDVAVDLVAQRKQ